MNQIPVQTYEGWNIQPSTLAPTYMDAFKPPYLADKARRIKLKKYIRQKLRE